MTQEKPGSGDKNAIYLKAVIIFILALVLLIPATLIQGLISEREQRQREAVFEVSSKWGNSQTLTGPILSVPYYEYYKDNNNNFVKEIRYAHFLPEVLEIEGGVVPEKRYRGIYEVVVYNSTIKISGNYNSNEIVIPDVIPDNIMYEKAFLSFGLSDLRGLEKQITLNWNGKSQLFNPGVETGDVIQSGINTRVDIGLERKDNPDTTAGDILYFDFELSFKGSQQLFFVPVGKETNVDISSTWANPSFDGAFLPDDRVVDNNGFKAHWNILNLNRNFPQSWTGSKYPVYNSSFGVNLIVPADNYQKSTRTVKYAILIIVLTFVVFFFVELINKKSVHPLAYGLVGTALCIFYVLLISISEYLDFAYAYLAGSIMTIGLITIYIHSFLKNLRLSTMVCFIMLLLYGFIFTIIQIQDYSLLMGSLGLFAVTAILMYFSRKINWNGSRIE